MIQYKCCSVSVCEDIDTYNLLHLARNFEDFLKMDSNR